MRITTTTANRLRRLKRHLRSCTSNPLPGRQADRAVRGEFAPGRRSLCRRPGVRRGTHLAR
jgi:hypothetical protein